MTRQHVSGRGAWAVAALFGLASAGLRLAVERAWELIREDEICLSVRRDNPASLRVQLKNGAYIHHADADHFYTRIKKIR